MSEIPAARNALRMLKYISSRSRPVRAVYMSRELGIPRSTTYQLLKVLQDEGFLVHFPEAKEYGLSSALAEMGSVSSNSDRIQLLASPILNKLLNQLEIPVVAFVGILRGPDIRYVAKDVGPKAPTVIGGVGIQLPAHLTATGRAILAGLKRRQILAMYPNRDSFFSRTSIGPNNFRELTTLLEETRSRGWALEESEISEGLATVGAVASDHNGYPAAAIGMTFRIDDIPRAQWPDLATSAINGSNDLSRRLKGKS